MPKFERLVLLIGLAGAFILVAGLIFLNRETLLRTVESWSAPPARGNPEKSENFARKAADVEEEAAEDGISINYPTCILACKIFQQLQPAYQGDYEPTWREQVLIWHIDRARGKSSAARPLPVRNRPPARYWSERKSALTKILKYRHQAFLWGGQDIKTAENLAQAGLARCRPYFALKAWADYVHRFAEVERFKIRESGFPRDIQDFLLDPERFGQHLVQYKDYIRGLENYLRFYHIYNLSLNYSARLKRDQPLLRQSDPEEALAVINTLLLVDRPTRSRAHLFCDLADIHYQKARGLPRDSDSFRAPERRRRLLRARNGYQECLKTNEFSRTIESHLGLAEIYLETGHRQLARYHWEQARGTPDKTGLIRRMGGGFKFHWSWVRRLDRIHFDLRDLTSEHGFY